LWLGQRRGLTHEAVEYALERRADQAYVKELHAHRFRHPFAHRWLSNGGQERDLMRLAGWARSWSTVGLLKGPVQP
jgi:site-specific recombinase XerD